ncbi:MAG: hypothetical protein K2Y05_07390 [Hyphomicrobiaceae bacterium]|nr:hypothetical protein [Hyphomicrobiaceae bacterium]
MSDVRADPKTAVPKASVGETRAVFNAAFFKTFTLGAAALEAEIIGLFLAELPLLKMAIHASIESDTWHGAVHRLRGAALGIGAERLADAAKAAENLAADDDADRLRALADMTDEMSALEAELLSRGFQAAA